MSRERREKKLQHQINQLATTEPLSLDIVSLSREDLLLLAGAAMAVQRHAQYPRTPEGSMERAMLQGAIDRAQEALGLAARALGSETRSNGN